MITASVFLRLLYKNLPMPLDSDLLTSITSQKMRSGSARQPNTTTVISVKDMPVRELIRWGMAAIDGKASDEYQSATSLGRFLPRR